LDRGGGPQLDTGMFSRGQPFSKKNSAGRCRKAAIHRLLCFPEPGGGWGWSAAMSVLPSVIRGFSGNLHSRRKPSRRGRRSRSLRRGPAKNFLGHAARSGSEKRLSFIAIRATGSYAWARRAAFADCRRGARWRFDGMLEKALEDKRVAQPKAATHSSGIFARDAADGARGQGGHLSRTDGLQTGLREGTVEKIGGARDPKT